MAQNNTTILGPVVADRVMVNCLTLHIQYPLYGWYKYNYIIVASVNLALAPLAGILNLLVLLAISKENRLQSISNILLANLCLTDMLTGFIVQPMFAALNILLTYGLVNCPLFMMSVVIGHLVATVSYLTLLAIWTDRYFAIFQPFRYIELATKSLLVKVLSAQWISVTMLVFLSLLTKEFLLHSIVTMITTPISFGWSFYVQLRTAYLVKRMKGQATAQENEEFLNAVNDNSSSRATKVAALVLTALFVCSIPQCVIYVWGFLFSRPDGLYVASAWGSTLMLANSTCNPVIYCFQMKEIREGVFKRIRSFSKDDTVVLDQSTGSVDNL